MLYVASLCVPSLPHCASPIDRPMAARAASMEMRLSLLDAEKSQQNSCLNSASDISRLACSISSTGSAPVASYGKLAAYQRSSVSAA